MLLDLLYVGHRSALGKSGDRVLDNLLGFDVFHSLAGCEGLLELWEKTGLVVFGKRDLGLVTLALGDSSVAPLRARLLDFEELEILGVLVLMAVLVVGNGDVCCHAWSWDFADLVSHF